MAGDFVNQARPRTAPKTIALSQAGFWANFKERKKLKRPKKERR